MQDEVYYFLSSRVKFREIKISG